MKKEILVQSAIVIVLLLLISIPAVKSLFIPGGFTAHDLTHHVVRQISMDKLLSEGQFPPRWSGELNNGYGYPVFLFNYPLPALLGEVFHELGMGYVTAVKAVLFSSMILSILGMYLFLKSLLGSKLAPFLGAVFYLYAPIRFLNVYVSASVGSALGAAILPFVFWSMVEISKQRKWAFLSGGLFFGLLILAHNVTTLVFTPLILTFATYLVWQSKNRGRVFSNLAGTLLLGLALSAWFWLPAIIEKQYIIFDSVFGDFYKSQFVSFYQLLRSPWGYGLSHPQNPEPGDMSYQLGLIHFLVIVLLAVCLIFIKNLRILGGFVLIFFWGSVFLMLKISLPLWENLGFLSLIQFPLRFSALAVFTSSIAAAILVKYLPFKKSVFMGLLLLVLYANRNHWHINEVFDPGKDYYLNHKTTTASYNEHLPKWGRAMEKRTGPKLEFVGGGGNVQITKDYSGLVLAEVEATTSSKLRLNQFYFPGWQIKVDNQEKDFNYLIDGESYGLMVFDISSGKHIVLAEFKNIPLRNLADFISFTSVVLWIGLLCKLLMPHLFTIKKSS